MNAHTVTLRTIAQVISSSNDDHAESNVDPNWPSIPWSAPSSWNGWSRRPNGIQYDPVITVSSEPPAYSRYSWDDLPVNGRYRDAFWLIPASINNGIISNSTFASTQHVSSREQARVMAGYRRCIKSVCGVSL